MQNNIFKGIKGSVKSGVPLKRRTTFKIGGPVRFFIEPRDASDLKSLINLVKRYRISTLVIGAGSNILASDNGVRRALIHLNAPCFCSLSVKKDILEAGAGCLLNQVVFLAASSGLTGVEFLAGIPGTIGGALAMNAGAWGSCIADRVLDVTVMDRRGNLKTLSKKNAKFQYRSSGLGAYVIISTRLKLSRGAKEAIKNRIKGYLLARRATQDLSKPSAGCVFKNPAGYSAGRLIDACGLKGKRMGGAGISPKHANFFLNLKDASARDVLGLMELARKEVKKKFRVNLQPEIKIWR